MATDLTAIILAGGRGTRLRPLTDDLPKCLVPINGKPLVQYLIESLLPVTTDIVLCVGYRAADVRSRFHEGIGGYQIQFSDAGLDASMTDRILKVHPGGRFLVCYADELSKVDIPRLIKTHLRENKSMSTTICRFQTDVGLFGFGSGRSPFSPWFDEKPVLPYWTNIGFMLCDVPALRYFCPGETMANVLQRALNNDDLAFSVHMGPRVTVNNILEFEEAERVLK